MESQKAPGPDGLNAGFINSNWILFREDIVRLFRSGCRFPPGFNSSFIALIQKVKKLKEVKDYRPISLI